MRNEVPIYGDEISDISRRQALSQSILEKVSSSNEIPKSVLDSATAVALGNIVSQAVDDKFKKISFSR